MFFPAVPAGLIKQASFRAVLHVGWRGAGGFVCPQSFGPPSRTALLVHAGRISSSFSVPSTSCSFHFPLLNTRRLQEQEGAGRQTTGRRVPTAAAVNPTGIPRDATADATARSSSPLALLHCSSLPLFGLKAVRSEKKALIATGGSKAACPLQVLQPRRGTGWAGALELTAESTNERSKYAGKKA